MVPLNPKITAAGLALIPRPDGPGLAQVTLTHIGIGTGKYDMTGRETRLQNEVARYPVIAGGHVVDGAIGLNQIQLGVTINDRDPDGRSANDQWIGEIGFYAGSTLFAVWSRASKYLFYKSSEFDVPLAYKLDVSALPVGSITVKLDMGVIGMQSLLFQHEQQADPHPQYITAERLAKADAHKWAEKFFNYAN